jgi:hypothetical protein
MVSMLGSSRSKEKKAEKRKLSGRVMIIWFIKTLETVCQTMAVDTLFLIF